MPDWALPASCSGAYAQTNQYRRLVVKTAWQFGMFGSPYSGFAFHDIN